ncbi:MAG: SusC/RagA family TonB-linked outer membrane protein [Paludibacter sp.]|nr:SusC/RagA family TonB-linked outer membrane protein [Paludibacter sp.]
MKHLKYFIVLIALVAGINITAFAQKSVVDCVIKGTVVETATGKPISGASITIPGVTSVLSNDNGEFIIKKTIDGAQINVVALGYAPKRLTLNGKSEIKIFMIDESFKGNYEDVLLPFGTSNALENALTVSTHENRNDYLTGASSVETILQTSVNGLNVVSRSGSPNAGANISLNGINSLNINSQPLIVVDGIIYDNQPIYSLISGNNISALSDIDIKDIENITVLKDGASIYGSKGANGVILINTIQAKSSATRINFYTYAGVNFEPTTNYKMMGATDYKNYISDMAANYGLSTNQINSLPYINTDKPVVEDWGVSGNEDYYRYNQYTDWQNEVFQSSLNQNYHLNITGGNETTLLAISVGYLGQGGNVKNTDYSRYSTRVNAQIKMNDWFKLNANISFIYSERNLSFEGLNRNFSPVYSSLIKAPFTSPYVYNVLGEQTPNYEGVDVFNVSNPVVLNQYTSSNNRFRFVGIMNGQFTFSEYLKGDIIFGLTSDKVTKERVFLPNEGVAHDVLASGYITNESQQLRNSLSQVNTNSFFSYDRIFDYVHNFSAHLGFRFQSGTNELDYGMAYNTSSDEMQTLGDGLNSLAQVGGSLGSWNYISDYLNVNYGYMNKYFVSVNTALDGSSRFGADAEGLKMFNHVYGFFPSVNAAWIITSEEFMKNQQVLDVLKLRAGYSVTGNDDIGNYAATSYYIPQGLLGAYGLVRGNIPNSSLKWETNNKASFGVDASFLKERLNLSLDLYSSRTDNLINIKQLNTVSGFSVVLLNDGALSNQGIDLNVNGRIIDHSNLKWDMGLNISTYKNTLTSSSNDELLTPIAGGTIRSKVGAPVAQFYGYQTDGILSSTAIATSENLNIENSDGSLTPFTAGDVRFVDQDGNHTIDSEDMVVIGDPNPDFFGSINSRIQWKNFSLNALIAYSYGNDVYNAMRASLESMSGTDNQTQAAIYRWRTDGQETSMPKAVWSDPMGNSRFSDRWIEDGSYIRLKSISLAYDFNIKSNIFKNAQVYLTANNLLTFTKYLGYDPEFSIGQSALYSGIDSGVSPQPKTVLIGVKIGL